MKSGRQTCRACTHFTRPAGDRLVAVSSFGRCTQLDAGFYRAPGAVCRFDIPRWSARRA
jgi:hypothetical protein